MKCKEIIEGSIKRHGLLGPIIKARLNFLKDKPLLTVNGHKREEVCVGLGLKPEALILEPKTLEEYLQMLRDFKEPRLNSGEKKDRANIYAFELKKAGCKPGQIVKAVAYLTGMSYRQTVRYLSPEYKDQLQQERASGCQMTAENDRERANGLRPRDDYDFLDKTLWIRIRKEVKDDKNLYALLDAVKDHFLTVKDSLALKNAGIGELSEALLEKLEDPKVRLSEGVVARLRAILPEE
jgi:hypothetical protein